MKATIAKSDTFEHLAGASPRIAPFALPSEHGAIEIHHVREMLALLLPEEAALGDTRIAIVLYDPTGIDGERFGLLANFTPDEARATAAGLLRMANKLDGGRGRN